MTVFFLLTPPPRDAVLKATAEAYHANAVVFSFFRDGCCFPVLLIAAALIEKGCRFPRSGRELAVFCGLGVTGMWGNQLFYILGLYYTSATIASCWQPAIPVFAAFIAIVLGVEPFPPLSKLRGWFKLFGILFAAGGAIVLTLGKPAGSASEMKKATLGNIFLLLNCSCMGLYVNIQKVFIFNDKQGSVGERWKPYPVHVTAWSYFFGAIAMIISAVVGFYGEFTFFGFGDCNGVGEECPTNSFHVPKQMLIGLAYAVLISSVRTARHPKHLPFFVFNNNVLMLCGAPQALCYGLISFTNKHLPATVVTAFWPFQVPVAVFLASCSVGIFEQPLSGSDTGSGSDASAASGPFCENMTLMELGGFILIVIGCAAPPKPPKITAQLAQQSRGFVRELALKARCAGVVSLAGVTVADHMERKENERKLSDSPPLLYKSAIN